MALYIGNKKYCAVKKIGVNNQDILITQNGNYTPEEDYSGFGLVRVNVPEPVLTQLTVNPSTETQTIDPLNDGFSQVIVNPVTAAIDADIIASNIKKDINILGVTGTLEFTTEELTANPTIKEQVFTPTKNGYSKVTINPVTASIDSNIIAGNIKDGVEILGVEGTLIESNETTRNITANGYYTAPEPYTGFSSVEVDVEAILEPLTITPTTSQQVFSAEDAYHGFSPVTINAVTAAADANIKPENIVKGITILGVTGTAELVLQEKHVTIDASTPTITTYTPDQDGCNGYSKFIFDLSWLEDQLQALNSGDSDTSLALQNKTVSASGVVTADTGYDGLGQVTVDLSAYENQIADLQERVAELEAQLGI